MSSSFFNHELNGDWQFIVVCCFSGVSCTNIRCSYEALIFYIYLVFMSQGTRMRFDFHPCVKQKGSIPHPIWLQVLCETREVFAQFDFKCCVKQKRSLPNLTKCCANHERSPPNLAIKSNSSFFFTFAFCHHLVFLFCLVDLFFEIVFPLFFYSIQLFTKG
jgi:hypothetical protein